MSTESQRRARAAAESAIYEGLPDLAGGLASVYALLAVGHAFCMPAEVAPAAVGFAGASSALSFALWLCWRRRPPASHPRRWAGTLGGLGFANGLLTLALSPVPRETTGIAVFMLGGGLLFLSRTRLLAMLAIGFAAWGAAVFRAPADPGWPQAGFVLALVSALSLLIQSVRARYERMCVELLEGQARLRDSLAALRESERRFRIIAESSADGILTMDESGCIQFASTAVTRILGHPVEALLGRELARLVPERLRERHQAGLRRYLETGAQGVPWEGVTLPALHADGSEIPVEISFAESALDGRRLFVGSVRDVRARKRAEEERLALERRLQQAQKLESLGLLAAGIAHDFNNLLTVIVARANAALTDLRDEDETRSDLEEIRVAGQRASLLTRQLLAYAGRGASKPVLVDLSQEVREVADLLSGSIAKRIRLSLDLSEEIPAIEIDPAQLQQVVMNLVMNAADAVGDEEGWIHVATGSCILSEGEIAQFLPPLERAPGRYVRLEVSDDGCGIAEVDRQRIFDPFFTTKAAGRGLGLASLLGIARQQGGGVRVESRPERGTCFEVFLPVSARPPSAAPRREAQDPAAADRVLVIDDEPGVRHALRRSLETMGIEVD